MIDAEARRAILERKDRNKTAQAKDADVEMVDVSCILMFCLSNWMLTSLVSKSLASSLYVTICLAFASSFKIPPHVCMRITTYHTDMQHEISHDLVRDELRAWIKNVMSEVRWEASEHNDTKSAIHLRKSHPHLCCR